MEDYKEKYEMALERAKKNYDTAQDLCNGSQIGVECFKNTLTNIFPELKESEDERIRKALIEMVHDTTGDELWIDYNVHKEEALAWLERQGEKKSADMVEPRFKVKYAGSEYNVLEVKDIAGVTFYGIEDEPNHIDYVKAENCEIISGYAIKENGSQYPTKPAVFSEKKPTAWGEEDEKAFEDLIGYLNFEGQLDSSKFIVSLRDRLKGGK